MSKSTKYNGSKKLIVRDSLLTTPDTVDKALDRLELRFGYLQDKRHSLETSLAAADGLEAKGKIVDSDKAIVTEMESLRDTKATMVKTRRELVEAREQEISTYVFDPVSLEDDVETRQPEEKMAEVGS